MDKLIVHHGDRVTEHELGDSPITVGRDPECDLFFADKKLSRKHARFERSGAGLRLVDLDSRNGSWVNEVRVEARDIAPGDEIRLGGLRIQIERERELDEADQSTIYLTPETPPVPDTGTVVLEASPIESASSPSATMTLSPDDSSTVFLGASGAGAPSGSDEADETLKRPEPETTVVLSGELPAKLYDTGTVVFRASVEPVLPQAKAQAPPPAEAIPEVELIEDEEAEGSLTGSVTYVPPLDSSGGGRAWAARFTPLVAALGLFAFVVVALPVLRILSAALVEESAARARALVALLAAANEAALAEGRLAEVSIERVAREPGVVRAYVISSTGEILAPREASGREPEVEGLPGALADIRSFREGRARNGDRILAEPVVHRGRRVGVAILTHRSPAVGPSGMALLFGSLLLAIAVLGVILAARKMTVNPLNELRLEVEALGEQRAGSLPVERPYRELSQLASSLNRLLAARAEASRGKPTN